jgi:hypothetical protein
VVRVLVAVLGLLEACDLEEEEEDDALIAGFEVVVVVVEVVVVFPAVLDFAPVVLDCFIYFFSCKKNVFM